MERETSRFIAVALTESEWQALRAVKPNPTAWLKQEIDRTLEEAGDSPADRNEEDSTSFRATI